MNTEPKAPKPSVDELVLALFNTVQQKQRDIAASEKPQWATTCTVGTDPESVKDRINIQTVMEPAKLADMLGFLLQRRDYFHKAEELLGVKIGTFKWMGYTVEQWTKDFKTRLAQISLTTKRAELKQLEGRLDKLITMDQRRELELAAIQREFGDIAT